MSKLYGVIDTARDPGLYALVMQSPKYACLFAGELQPPLKMTAPYLVELAPLSALQEAWRTEGWGRAWGIVIRSSLEIEPLRRHLRQFLSVRLPDGQMVLFRFYDPRVWRAFWPGFSAEEQARWLLGIDEFVVEDANSRLRE